MERGESSKATMRRNKSSRHTAKGSDAASGRSGMLHSRHSAVNSSRRMKGTSTATTMRSGKGRRDHQRVYLHGVDVTPKSLLENTGAGKKSKKKRPGNNASVSSSIGLSNDFGMYMGGYAPISQ